MSSSWSPPGPVAAAFYENDAPISCLMGPIRGGKTIVGLQRGVAWSYAWPESEPGLRRVKFSIIRRLWKDLEATTMQSWFEWYPRNMPGSHWIGDPPTHRLRLQHPDGGLIDLQVEFKATGDLRIEEALRGYEMSYGYVDEVDMAPPNALTFLWSRSGSYPPGMLRRAPRMVWGTCNAPEEDNWVVKDFIDEPAAGHVLFRQPSGLSPQAENLAVVGAGYYAKQAEIMKPHERKRFIENIPGLSPTAEAVYDEFNPDIHVAAAELAVLDRQVVVGMDAGGTPAAGVWQQAANGQWRKLAELTTHAKEHGSITGPNRFGETLAALLAERCRGLPVRGLADPSAAHGADTAAGEASWIDTVARICGFPIIPAPGNNDPSIRQEALRLPMGQMIDGRAPGLLLCPVHCKLTARALARDYRHQVTGGRRTGILKNWASHLVEADQYALLDGAAYHRVLARTGTGRGRPGGPARTVIAQHDYSPFTT